MSEGRTPLFRVAALVLVVMLGSLQVTNCFSRSLQQAYASGTSTTGTYTTHCWIRTAGESNCHESTDKQECTGGCGHSIYSTADECCQAEFAVKRCPAPQYCFQKAGYGSLRDCMQVGDCSSVDSYKTKDECCMSYHDDCGTRVKVATCSVDYLKQECYRPNFTTRCCEMGPTDFCSKGQNWGFYTYWAQSKSAKDRCESYHFNK